MSLRQAVERLTAAVEEQAHSGITISRTMLNISVAFLLAVGGGMVTLNLSTRGAVDASRLEVTENLGAMKVEIAELRGAIAAGTDDRFTRSDALMWRAEIESAAVEDRRALERRIQTLEERTGRSP